MKKANKKGMGGYLKPRKRQGGMGMMIEPSKEINFNSPNRMAKNGGLKGGQKKLDKNKDGKISGADFKMMKKGGVKKSYGGSTKMGGDMMQKGMGGMNTYKAGGVKNFKPHMMYDPKTGKGYKANTVDDHLRMKKKGYNHEELKKKAQTGVIRKNRLVGSNRKKLRLKKRETELQEKSIDTYKEGKEIFDNAKDNSNEQDFGFSLMRKSERLANRANNKTKKLNKIKKKK